nr:hypothetical protein [uncultured bacterium]
MNLIKSTRRRDRGTEFPVPFSLFRNGLDRLFERMWNEPWFVPSAFEPLSTAWMPPIDLAETENEITIRAEIPGVDPADINVTVDENFLTISGEKSMTKEESEKDYYFCERSFGSFSRRIELPVKVQADKITANYSDGVLSIRAPKVESAKPRRVDVKVEGRSVKGTTTNQRVPVQSA